MKEDFKRSLYSGLTTLCWSVLLLQTFIMYTPIANIFARSLTDSYRTNKAEAIIVLSGGAFPDGTLGLATLQRLTYAVQLYKEGKAKKIIFSGHMPHLDFAQNVAKNMAHFALSVGIPADNIIVEDKSITTYEHAMRVKKIMQEYNIKDALLVTSAIHALRARLVFEKMGLKVSLAPVNAYEISVSDPLDRISIFRAVIREYSALLYYKLKGRI